MLSGSALFWSGNFVLGRAVSGQIEPISLAYMRWCLALIIFLPFTFRAVLIQWSVIRENLAILVFLGVVGVAGFNTFAYLGLQDTSATSALLINSFIPILIIILSRIYPGTRITRSKLIGILLSTAGVIILISRGNWDSLLALEVNRGDLWVLMAAFSWAVYSIGLRWRPAELSAPAFLSFSMIIGVLVLSPFYWFNLLHEAPIDFGVNNLLVIGYVAIFASIGAFLCWNQGVKIVGAGTAGQFIHLMPIFGAAMAVGFLSEQLFWFHAAGAFAIAGGIFITLKFAD